MPILIIIPKKKPLKDFTAPDNIVVIYQTKAIFDAKIIQNSFIERVLVSQNRLRGITRSILVLDQATCHTTTAVKKSLKKNKIELCLIPKRFTNLLQPADISWLKSIKNKYREKWNKWFLESDKLYTKNGNIKSPGYGKCIQWISEIWAELNADIIMNSFSQCGIVGQDENRFHSVLKKIMENEIIHNTVQDEIDNDLFFDENPDMSEEEDENIELEGDESEL